MTAAGDLDRAVSAAVARLYQAFGQRPRAAIQGCPCCVDPADSAAMARLAREDVPLELASRYAFKAMSTWGDEADFRWYLPRIAELVARGGLELDLLTGKLTYGSWTRWPEPEQAALVAFLDAWWSRAVAGSADGSHMLEELLAVRIDLGLDVEPWLDGLADAPLPALADLVQIAIAIADRGAVATALRPRLVTAAMLDRLTAGYVATADERLAAAADLLTCEPSLA
jgi:hypothetical protein